MKYDIVEDNIKIGNKIICKLKEDKQDEFIENYDYQSYKYANKDDCYYLKLSKHLILDQDTLEIIVPTNKLEQEDIDLIAKLNENDMIDFYEIVADLVEKVDDK